MFGISRRWKCQDYWNAISVYILQLTPQQRLPPSRRDILVVDEE